MAAAHRARLRAEVALDLRGQFGMGVQPDRHPRQIVGDDGVVNGGRIEQARLSSPHFA